MTELWPPTVVEPGDTVHVLAWNGCRLATVKAMSPDAICGWRVLIAFDDASDAWLPLAPRGTDLLGWHLPMLDCVLAAQSSSSGKTPHVTSTQHPSTTPPDPKQTHHTPKQGRPKMRDSQNKDSTETTPDPGGQKEGTCSTTPSDPEQIRPLTPTFQKPPSTTSANPPPPDAPSNPMPPTGTPEQGTPVQVGKGAIWCASCGADGADSKQDLPAPVPERWRAAGLCVWCGSHIDPLSGLCVNRHRATDATPYDAEVRNEVGIGGAVDRRRARDFAAVRKLAQQTLAEALSEGRRRTRDPRHAPPVGFVESVLQTAKAVDAEHWREAEDAITETVVHLRAVAVLLEDVSPPGEMLRLRALFARSSFAAEFLADELSHVRELLRREVKKGAAS